MLQFVRGFHKDHQEALFQTQNAYNEIEGHKKIVQITTTVVVKSYSLTNTGTYCPEGVCYNVVIWFDDIAPNTAYKYSDYFAPIVGNV